MKEIQGRLKNKNRPRSTLGRAEKKQRLITALQPLTQLCCPLQHHHVHGWPSIRTPALGLPLGPATGPGCPSEAWWSLLCPRAISPTSVASSSTHRSPARCGDTSLGGKGWASEEPGRAFFFFSFNVASSLYVAVIICLITIPSIWIKHMDKPKFLFCLLFSFHDIFYENVHFKIKELAHFKYLP